MNFLQDILSFLINYFMSIPELVKTIFHCLLHSKQNHKFTPVYPSLQTESISSSCAYDFDQELLFEPHDIKDQPCDPHDTTVDVTSFPHNCVSSNIQNRYRPLQLPLILHDFPTNTTSTFLSLMVNPKTLQLRNIYKPLSIFLTSLR